MTAAITLEHVDKHYGNGEKCTYALRNVSMTINKGDFIAVVGESGSGKSTLLNVIGLLDKPTSGDYRFGGVDMVSASPKQLATIRASRIGFIFQSFHLLAHRTVLDNVAFAGLYSRVPFSNRQDNAKQALQEVGLSDKGQKMPNELSGGERQRVAIARAISQHPNLLLCDEPTGNLDSQRASEILGIFSRLHAQGQTIVMVTHDERQADCADRMFRVIDGRVREEA